MMQISYKKCKPATNTTMNSNHALVSPFLALNKFAILIYIRFKFENNVAIKKFQKPYKNKFLEMKIRKF